MPDVAIFKLDNQDINVKDSTARSAAQAAQRTATQASQTASEAATTARQAQTAASSAQTAAEAAQTAAETAQTAAETAQSQVQEILDLSRLEISYESATETITFTTFDHEPTT